MDPKQAPDPDHKHAWPRYRNQMVRKLTPTLTAMAGIEPYVYQQLFLKPPPPYKLHECQFLQLAGAKRIGKSMILGVAAMPYTLIPNATIRLYAPEHENAQREFAHIDKLLFGPKGISHQIPELKEHLVKYQPDPSVGRLEMAWDWGANIRSMSWERRKQWAGEPIDLGIICEPGLFDSISIYTRWIKPNLQDRTGLCRSAGTVDNPWMFDMHEMAHNHAEHPDIYCCCEIPRWANKSLDINKRSIDMARREETIRDFSINWLGLWETYSNVAYEKWNPENHVHVVTKGTYERMQARNGRFAGWDHYLSLDTGRYCSCGEYIVNPQGVIVRIREWANYAYQAGQIVTTDNRGFRPWFNDIIRELGGRCPLVYIDPSSQMKLDLEAMGIPHANATNGHETGVNAVNEYLAKKQFYLVKPEGAPRTILEFELPKVKWHETESGVGGYSRLQRGNDHMADEFRYALASRPLAAPYVPERPKSIVELDIAEMAKSHEFSDLDDAGFEGAGGMGYYE